MKAFSIKQPWLDAILYGGKTTENRTWKIPAEHIGVPVLLHSSAAPDRHAVLPDGADSAVWPLHPGEILAVATFTGYHLDNDCCHPWGNRSTAAKDVYHWHLTDIRPLKPVPCKGTLQFWTPPDPVLDAVRAQIEEVAL